MPSESQIRSLVRSIIEEAIPDGRPSPGTRAAIDGSAARHGSGQPTGRQLSAGQAPAGKAPAGPAAGARQQGSQQQGFQQQGSQQQGPQQDDIAIGADHGGYVLKDALVALLRDKGWQVRDCGTSGPEAVDYPDLAHEVARLVADGTCRWGIVVDGAGIGSAMVANKVPGVRAALCYDLSTARNSREHNHANVLTLGAGLIGEGLARQIVMEWLATPWGGDRHERRVAKITDVEGRYLSGARQR